MLASIAALDVVVRAAALPCLVPVHVAWHGVCMQQLATLAALGRPGRACGRHAHSGDGFPDMRQPFELQVRGRMRVLG